MLESHQSIAICGTGIAAHLTAIALAKSLPPHYQISLVRCHSENDYDAFYGHVCSPGTYSFHLKLGLTEPDLMQNTDTSFSYGTQYRQWAQQDLSWVQCFHLPLPVQDGVEFQQCLLRAGMHQLEPYLVSAQAAIKGRFAHPPTEQKSALSRAEYGYQLSTDEYGSFLKKNLEHRYAKTIECIDAKQLDVVCQQDNIERLIIDGEQIVEADWYLDCSGPEAVLVSAMDRQQDSGSKCDNTRQLNFFASKRDAEGALSSARTLDSFDFGWQSNTPIRGQLERLTVFHTQTSDQALQQHGDAPTANTCRIGRRQQAWQGNCIAIGHAAGIIEPLTPAPLMLLQADIQRLLELVPISSDAELERTEYNRRFQADYDQASLFNRAMYCLDTAPETPFWQAASALPIDHRLAIKLTQFESRGIVSMFDLEPFNAQDWLIQFFGMQRRPVNYSRFADRFPRVALENWFATQRNGIDALTDKMPKPEHYIERMLDYLKTQS